VTFLSKKAFNVRLRPRNISVKNSVLALSSNTAHVAGHRCEERCYRVARILPSILAFDSNDPAMDPAQG